MGVLPLEKEQRQKFRALGLLSPQFPLSKSSHKISTESSESNRMALERHLLVMLSYAAHVSAPGILSQRGSYLSAGAKPSLGDFCSFSQQFISLPSLPFNTHHSLFLSLIQITPCWLNDSSTALHVCLLPDLNTVQLIRGAKSKT